MTIDEAITQLKQLPLPLKTRSDYKKHQAVRLGIEALKRIKEGREMNYEYFSHWLPGETKE
jgi:hypothetical protein